MKQPIIGADEVAEGDPALGALARPGATVTDVAGGPLLSTGAGVSTASGGPTGSLTGATAADDVERRLHYRIPVMLEVDYRAADTFLFAYITDISAMGIFIRTSSPETPGTHLHLRFTPPGDEAAIECEGDVIWINPPREGRSPNPGMGIQLSDLSSEDRRHLVELVRTFAYLDVEDSRQQN